MTIEEPLMDAHCENVYYKRVFGGDVSTVREKTVLRPALGLDERKFRREKLKTSVIYVFF